MLTCQGYYPHTCRSKSCRDNFLPSIQKQCSNHSNIDLQLRSSSDINQIVQFEMKFLELTSIGKCRIHEEERLWSVCFLSAPSFFTEINPTSNGTILTNLQLIQKCLAQDLTKQPVIVDTDADIDDLWAIHYLINVSRFRDLCKYIYIYVDERFQRLIFLQSPQLEMDTGTLTKITLLLTENELFCFVVSMPFYSTSNVLSFLGLVGCTNGIGVASGLRFALD